MMMKSRVIVCLIGLLFAVVLAASPVMAETDPVSAEGAPLSSSEDVYLTAPSDEGDSIGQKPRRVNSRPPRRVKSPIPPESTPVKFEGRIEHIDRDTPGEPYHIVVHGEQILVTSETVITPAGHILEEEDYVYIDAVCQDSEFVATEFRGIITKLPAQLFAGTDREWIIAGKSVEVSTKDNVYGVPVVGQYAHVTGWVWASGRIKAERIDVLDPAEIVATFEFKGLIQEKSSTAPESWTMGGVQGRVDANTDRTGEMQVGTVVRARGRRLPDDQLVFEEIVALTEEDELVYYDGIIEQITEETWIVGGKEIEIDGMTFIDESGGRKSVGMWAEVTAHEEPWGELIALRIRVERPE
jgi:hypothetical protein